MTNEIENSGGARKSQATRMSGLIIGGFTLLGIGVGQLIGNTNALTMVGIGAGMLIAAALYYFNTK